MNPHIIKTGDNQYFSNAKIEINSINNKFIINHAYHLINKDNITMFKDRRHAESFITFLMNNVPTIANKFTIVQVYVKNDNSLEILG